MRRKPRNISSASAKSKPCFRILARFFASSHSNVIVTPFVATGKNPWGQITGCHEIDKAVAGGKHYFSYKSPIVSKREIDFFLLEGADQLREFFLRQFPSLPGSHSMVVGALRCAT